MKTNWSSRAPRKTRAPLASAKGDDDRVLIYGWHPVAAAIGNPARAVRRLVATENGAHRLREQYPDRHIEIEIVRPQAIDRMLGPDAVHQGLVLETEPLPSPEFSDLAGAQLIVVLDQVTDPHNVGAILRSAAAFGADGLVMTARHSAPLDGVLAKSASGGLEYVPVHLVRNLGEALQELGEMGVYRVGLAGEADSRLEDARLQDAPASRAVALILGAEGRGLRERTRSLCDILVRIEAPGAIGSLNVSNAAAVALYALCGRSGKARQSQKSGGD